MNHKLYGKLSTVLILYFLIAFMFPFKALADSGYVIRYESPKYEIEGLLDDYPPFYYELLKDIDVEVGPDEKFTYSNEVSYYEAEPRHSQWYGYGRISMEGSIVKMNGSSNDTMILYGNMSFYIDAYYTADGDHNWIDYETQAVKNVLQFSYDGPYYIVAGIKGESGKNLSLGYDPQTSKSVDMSLTRIHYNKENQEVYRNLSNEFPPSGYNFQVFQNNPTIAVQTENTVASEMPGETSSEVAKEIVLGIVKAIAVAGVAAGLGAAGAAAGGSGTLLEGGEEREEGQSTYKMVIHKEFGNKIKYNGEPVFVYARMIQINSKGVEIERPDLTQKIQIFSKDGVLDIGPSTLSDSYVGASVYARATEDTILANEGIISFKFTGKGGVFQNNVKFMLIGKARIELSNHQIFVLANSGKSFELPFKLIDFQKEPKTTLKSMKDVHEFRLEVGKDKNGNNLIIVTDKADKKNLDKFFESFTCEIIAETEKEYVSSIFYVEMCYEGVLPDFLGKPKEIRGYKVSIDSDQMEKTIFDVKLGVWSEGKSTLEFVKGDSIEISLIDEREIFKLIGMEIKPDENNVLTKSKRYIARAEKNFPSTKPVKGTMEITATYGVKTFESKTEIDLIPDILQYEADYEKEYQACKRVIEIYMAPRFRGQKLYELEKARNNLGIEDFRLFRRNCWSIAERSIMQESQEYLLEAAWYDEAIATLDLVVYIGDIAFDLALAPIGGPITGFIVANVKSSFVKLCGELYAGTDKNIWELTKDIAIDRAVESLGSTDGLIEVPKADEPKKLVIWLTSYVLYRIGYHWQFDKDDNNNPIGITEAVKRGLLDFVGKGAGALLGDYLNQLGKGRWVEKISIADADQKLVNENVSKAAKYGLDTMDKAAEKADAYISKGVNALLEYIEKLKIGG